MKRFKHSLLIGILFSSIVMFIGCRGFKGITFERNADGSIGQKIPEVKITFIKEDGSVKKSIISDNNGFYRISLTTGRYRVTAKHPDYEDYSSVPGFFVVSGTSYKTGNFFLKKPRVTTVLLVRHGERANDSLNQAGLERAQKLAHVAYKAGVSAIFASEYNRTQQTVQPLADFLKIEPIIYTSMDGLVSLVLADHNGDVVLVAGHSNTVPLIARQFGAVGISTAFTDDFDNLLVVTRQSAEKNPDVNVVNLQYGEASLPDGDKKWAYSMTTILLLRHIEGGSVGGIRAEKLAHVASKLKSDMTTIYAASSTDTVQLLADELGVQVNTYDPSDLQGFIDQILLDHSGEVVVIAGNNNVLSETIKKLEGSPYPPIFSDEYDNLFLITVLGTGGSRVLSLQYGSPSPNN